MASMGPYRVNLLLVQSCWCVRRAYRGHYFYYLTPEQWSFKPGEAAVFRTYEAAEAHLAFVLEQRGRVSGEVYDIVTLDGSAEDYKRGKGRLV